MSRLPNESLLFKIRNGIRHPDYAFWWDWIDKQDLSETDREVLWTKLVDQWVEYLAFDLGENYSTAAISNFVFLSPLSQHKIAPIFVVANETKQFVLSNLITEFSDEAPKLILLFDDVTSYKRYLEPLYLEQDSDWQPSVGVFLSGVTYPHIALMACDDLLITQSILAHELTHFYTSSYSLPRWLDEGLASFVQHSVIKSSPLTIDRNVLLAHREYWTTNNLEDLLSGKLFMNPQSDYELADQMSEILVRNLLQSDIEKFRLFLSRSDAFDGGRSAATEVLNVDLLELSKRILT